MQVDVTCVGLIKAKEKLSEEEAISTFYEGLSVLCTKIKAGAVSYKSDAQLRSYLITTCLNKAKEYKRTVRGGKFIIPTDQIEAADTDYEEAFYQNQQEAYKTNELLYGINLNEVQEEEEERVLPLDMIRAFHDLIDKCKLLIVLKVLLGINHKEIVKTLGLFYELKNANVSKSILSRCKEKWKELSENQ